MKNKQVITLQVGNDNGNSEHDIVINGKLIQQPNVYSKINKLPNLEEVNPKSYAKKIDDNLIVTIDSAKVNNGTPTTYFVGNYAINSGNRVFNIEIGVDNNKLISDIPLVNTLAQIAGHTAASEFLRDESVEEIDVKVDMTTALPVNQYSKSMSTSMSEKFIGNHIVTVHLGMKKVRCNIEFEYVKTIPEAVPTVYYLKNNNTENELLDEYKKEYGETDFENKRILHVAIGEGTTEYPLTQDDNFDPNFLKGTNNGVGLAVEAILEEFKRDHRLPTYTRQDVSKALKDPMDKYHLDAVDAIQEQLEYQADEIYRTVKVEVERAKNNVDIICVYGGGSILMQSFLREKLSDFCKKTNIQLLYIDKPLSVSIEAFGMFEFTKSDIFKILKENYKNK